MASPAFVATIVRFPTTVPGVTSPVLVFTVATPDAVGLIALNDIVPVPIPPAYGFVNAFALTLVSTCAIG